MFAQTTTLVRDLFQQCSYPVDTTVTYYSKYVARELKYVLKLDT